MDKSISFLSLFGVFLTAALPHAAAGPIQATVGTTSVGSADGVAIWVNPSNPDLSVVIGAKPDIGPTVFALDGRIIQDDIKLGGCAGVDVRYDFPLSKRRISLVAGGVKNGHTIFVYTVNPSTRRLENILAGTVTTTVNPYGSCLYKSGLSGKYYLFITSKTGDIEQYELTDNGRGQVAAKRARTIAHREGTNFVIEACVADDDLGHVYFAQENECKVWRYNAEPDGGSRHRLVADARISAGDNVEGLAIYKADAKTGYLIVSVQGSWKYKVYTRQAPYTYFDTFEIVRTGGSGIVQSHDCIEVTTASLGPAFPHGMFVTQNANHPGGPNFEMVPWQSIKKKLRRPTHRGKPKGASEITPQQD